MLGLIVSWCDEIEEIYKEALDLNNVKSVSLENYTYEYARLSSKANFSEYANYFISWWGPWWIGKRYNGKNYVFCDYVPTELQDQIGLHESLHDLVEGTSDNKSLPHIIACREELKFLEKNPELYVKYADFWIKWEKNKEKLQEKYGDQPIEGSYFAGEIPNLDQIIREGKLKPVEILKLYQDTINQKYGHIQVKF